MTCTGDCSIEMVLQDDGVYVCPDCGMKAKYFKKDELEHVPPMKEE